MKVFEKDYKENLSLEKAVTIAYEALSKSLPEREKISLLRVQFAIITSDGFSFLSESDLKNFLK